MKKILLLLLFQTVFVFSQDAKLDSLINNTKNNEYDKANAFFELGEYYGNEDNYFDAIDNLSEALSLSIGNNNKVLISQTEMLLGKYYLLSNMLDLSLKHLLNSLLYYQEINDTINIISNHILLGNVYFDTENFSEALKQYNKAREFAEKSNDNISMPKVLNNIGIVYDEKQKYDTSIVYYNKALAYISKYNTEETETKVNILINIGVNYRERKMYTKAIETFHKALKISLNAEYTRIYKNLYFNIAVIYFLQDKLQLSKNYINKSLEADDKNNFDVLSTELYLLLSEISYKNNDLENAYLYQSKYITLKDSLEQIKNLENIAKITLAYKTFEKEKRLQKLELSNTFNKKMIQVYKKRIILLLSISVLFFLLLVGYIIFKNKVKKARTKIVDENLKVINLKKENIRLNKLLNTNNINNDCKYINSSLNDEERIRIITLIEKALNEDKVFLNKDISVENFVEIIDTNRTYFSQVLIEYYKKSFTELINELRIDEAKELLTSDYALNYTMEAISKEVGFNSISTFNRVFKKHTGITPSFFLKVSKNNMS